MVLQRFFPARLYFPGQGAHRHNLESHYITNAAVVMQIRGQVEDFGLLLLDLSQ